MSKQLTKMQKNKLSLNKKAIATLNMKPAQAKWIVGGIGFDTPGGTSKGEEEPECTSRPTTTVDTLITATSWLPL